MKSSSLKVPLIVLAVIVVVSAAVSQTVKRAHWQRDGMFGGHALAFFTHRLDLTDAQQAQAKEIMAKGEADPAAPISAAGPDPAPAAAIRGERQF